MLRRVFAYRSMAVVWVSRLSQHGLLCDLFHVLQGDARGMIYFFDTGQLVVFVTGKQYSDVR